MFLLVQIQMAIMCVVLEKVPVTVVSDVADDVLILYISDHVKGSSLFSCPVLQCGSGWSLFH